MIRIETDMDGEVLVVAAHSLASLNRYGQYIYVYLINSGGERVELEFEDELRCKAAFHKAVEDWRALLQ